MKLYGSLQNRLEENRQFVEEIKVGTGMTEYQYSDRHPYEVIEVKDQKHVTVRMMDHKHIGNGCMNNNWELISNPENPEYDMVKRGNYWYSKSVCTREMIESSTDPLVKLNVALAGFDYDTIMQKGSQTKYRKWNVSFGRADYYYDYSF